MLGLLAIVWVRGALFAFVSPPWQGPDETTHYQYLAALEADGRFLPAAIPVLPAVYDAVWDSATAFRIWDYNNWPIGSFLSTPSPQSQFLTRAGGLYYRLLFPVYTLTEGWPLDSRLFLLRVESASLMLVTVAATYATARTIFNRDTAFERAAAWVAAACVAFQPMYGFMSASLNDDNLVPPLAGLTILGVLRALRREQDVRPSYGWWGFAALSALCAVLAKRTGFAAVGVLAVGLLALALIWVARGRGWRRVAGWLTLLGFASLLVVFGYLLIAQPVLPPELTWRIQLQEDVFPDLAAALVRALDQPLNGWLERFQFLTLSFWGWFGWLKAPLAPPVISALRYGSLIVALGVAMRLALWAGRQTSRESRWRFALTLILLAAFAINFGMLLAQHFVAPEFFTLVGRYLFPSLGAWGVLTVVGWLAWWPRRWAVSGLIALTAVVVALDVYAWLFVMVPFYYA